MMRESISAHRRFKICYNNRLVSLGGINAIITRQTVYVCVCLISHYPYNILKLNFAYRKNIFYFFLPELKS